MILLLVVLICILLAKHQLLSSCNMCCKSSSLSAINTKSSAYKSKQICSSLTHTPLPSDLILKAISLTNRLNSIGESGQPCLNPELTVNQSVVKVFTFTQEDTLSYSDFTACNILHDTPILFKRCHNLFLSIQSYAFRKSMKAQYVDNLDFFLVSIILVNDDKWSIVLRFFRKPFLFVDKFCCFSSDQK